MEVLYEKPKTLFKKSMPYCPGCGHGIVHRLICEVIDELDIREKTIAIAPVGCSVCAYNHWDFDVSEAAHGRAAAVATGIKRVHPDKVVISYQGDGDLASIGMAETIHAANRGENFSVIFINNANYGMTGGQMAPTTLLDQVTTTTPAGRKAEDDGFPFAMAEMISQLKAVTYCVRTTTADIKGIRQTKKAIKKAVNIQLNEGGYSFIEILTNCNINWKMKPQEANNYILNTMTNVFPIGEFKNICKS